MTGPRIVLALYMALVQQGLRAYDVDVIKAICDNNEKVYMRTVGRGAAVLTQDENGVYMLVPELAANADFIADAIRNANLIFDATPEQRAHFSEYQSILYRSKTVPIPEAK